ncbi:MAG: hypothetical protein CUN55_03060 [Phototrophicales bacterium]|nr:MAG: hypothetical protein CUN55_03060 [Phototrophicales bacterium]
MRLSANALLAWVVVTVIFAVLGGYFSYTQARERTRQLNEIAPLEEGIDVLRTIQLLTGAAEPKLPDEFVENNAPAIIEVEGTTTPLPTELAIETSEPSEATQGTQTPTEAPTEPTATIVAEEVQAAQFGPQRINVLLLGIDQRRGETGPFPTDTIIVLSLNPAAKSGVVLSIPRDIYVTFPLGLGQGKINTANIVGENNQYPGGGPAFAKRVVSELLGIPIHYYVMINFDAFLTFVDAIGEVEVCPPEPIDDPKYPDGSYGYRPIHFDAGCQMLGAERLLEYSRTRATANGDIDRAARQQEVMFAIRDKIVSVTGLTNLLRNATTIWDSVSENIKTDLSFNEILGLAPFIEEVPRENIVNATIDYDSVLIQELPDGTQILVPIQSDILSLVAKLFQ